jgi:Holliday junction DNA helicase RuvA
MRLSGFRRSGNVLVPGTDKVDGIRPKQAVKILSGINAGNCPGVGRGRPDEAAASFPVWGKTAQKLVFSLKGKLPGRVPGEPQGKWADVIRALAEMGYDRKRVVETIARLSADLDGGKDSEQELFRKAIVELSS